MAHWTTAARRAALAAGLGVLLVGSLSANAIAGTPPPEQHSARAASPEDELLALYAPIVAVRDQPVDCESGEPYLPMSVEDLFAVPGLRLVGPDGATIDEPTLDDLAAVSPGPEWHIDVPGNALRPECTYEQLYDDLAAAPVAYGRIATDADHPEQLVVQYWFFYIYNDWNDRHEGDWEMVQLVFDAPTVEQALTTSPVEVMFAQHEGGEVSDWDGGPVQTRDGTHPVVYSAQGSHAAYYSSARWFGKSAQSGFGCDDTRAPIDEVSPTVVRLTGEESWLAFTGRWGEEQPSFNNGPTGPSTKTQWATPVSWVDDEGRVGAVDLPSDGSFATTSFCATVRIGSVAFLRFLDSPLRMTFSVLGIVVVLVLVVRRTRWRGASIEPVLQRRRAGQHLGGAILLVRKHLALFSSIGALLLVGGLVATGFQWLLSDATEFGEALDLLGSGSVWGSMVAALLGLAIIIPVTSIVYVAVAAAVRDLAIGAVAPTWSRSMSAIRAHPRSLAAELLTRTITNLLLFSVVLSPIGVWLLARWCVVSAAGLDSSHPMRRSADLTRTHRLRAGALAALTSLLSFAIPALVGTLLLILTGWSFLLVNVVTGVVGAVVIPVTAATMALLYGELAANDPLAEPAPISQGTPNATIAADTAHG